MKTWTAFAALLALGVVPARADDTDRADALRGDIELLKLDRDVDRALLREAMLRAGRARMGEARRPDSEEAEKRSSEETAVLEHFIREKRQAWIVRTAELRKKAAELAALERDAAARKAGRPNAPVKPGDERDRPGLIEKLEEAQVDVQLLQAQSPMYQQALDQALNALATAEFAAGNDETQRGKAEAERKRFDGVRARFVGFNMRLRLEQEKLAGLRERLGLNGMGGGFR